MGKKNDKRLCWNCDGYVHFHLERCPYCGVDLTTEKNSAFKALDEIEKADEKSFAPPYNNVQNTPNRQFAVSDEEWQESLEDKKLESSEQDEMRSKSELTALLLLLPGVALFVFALLLIMFSHDGRLHLEWKESFAYFYFLGSVPLLILGWKALNK